MFTYFGILRYSASMLGHVVITDKCIVVKLLITTVIPYSGIRSVLIHHGLFKYIRIKYGIPGQDVRIYSKQLEKLLTEIQKRTNIRTAT